MFNIDKFNQIFKATNTGRISVSEIRNIFKHVYGTNLVHSDALKFLKRMGFICIPDLGKKKGLVVDNIRYEPLVSTANEISNETYAMVNSINLSNITRKLGHISIAKMFLNTDHLLGKIFSFDSMVLFKSSSGTWFLSQREVIKQLNRLIVENCPQLKDISFVKKVSLLICDHAPVASSNMLKQFYNMEGFVPFNNGVLNLRNGVFTTNYDSHYFFKKMDLNYPMNNKDGFSVEKAWVKDNILEPILGCEKDPNSMYIPVLSYLIKALANDVSKFKFVLAIGTRNTAKSSLFEALQICITPLATSFNIENLICNKSSLHDSELKNKWLIDSIGRRFMVSSEATTTKRTTYSSNFIKRLQGGASDSFLSRDSHGQVIKISNNSSYVVSSNSYPMFNNNDVLKFTVIFRFARIFVDSITYNNLSDKDKESHSIIDTTKMVILAQDERLRLAFILILLDMYNTGSYVEPACSLLEKEFYSSTVDNSVLNLNSIFNITNNTEDFIDQSRMGEALTLSGYPNTKVNVGILKNYLTENGCHSGKKNTSRYLPSKGNIACYTNVLYRNDKLNFKKKHE